jgi:hypothetical protein
VEKLGHLWWLQWILSLSFACMFAFNVSPNITQLLGGVGSQIDNKHMQVSGGSGESGVS